MAERIYTLRDGAPLDEHGQPMNRRFNAAKIADRTIDELLGLSKGLIVDGAISEDEVIFLATWVQERRDRTSGWPFSVLSDRIARILLDGIITPEERADLLELLREITGGTQAEELSTDRSTSLPLNTPAPAIEFSHRTFCFTGKFFFGTRSACEQAVLAKDSSIHRDVLAATDFLVIGTLGSRDWIHSSHGRKIEKAVEWRERGQLIALVSEEHWVKHLS